MSLLFCSCLVLSSSLPSVGPWCKTLHGSDLDKDEYRKNDSGTMHGLQVTTATNGTLDTCKKGDEESAMGKYRYLVDTHGHISQNQTPKKKERWTRKCWAGQRAEQKMLRRKEQTTDNTERLLPHHRRNGSSAE